MYKYYLNARPASPGAVPNGFVTIDEQDKGGRYGAIYYESPLTDVQIMGYELQAELTKEQQAFLDVYKNHIVTYWYYFFKKHKAKDRAECTCYSELVREQNLVVTALHEAAKAIGIDRKEIDRVSHEQCERLKKLV